MKHIIAVIITMVALWGMYLIYQSDKEVNKWEEIQKVIAKSKVTIKLDNSQPIVQKPIEEQMEISSEEGQKKKQKELDEKLQALKNKAGNVTAFKVSSLYKQKCASCHGVNGEGIIGPKLIGKSAKDIYQALSDFKSGKRKNYVMYGLLSKMDEEELKILSDEIGLFASKLKEQQ
ncbi:MAG: c-type cytochrome [Sulfurovum sp.]|nr:c-type cytochrome [Sulfurovum sp.]MCB4745043.1 c-type cytochrome [Sulfurovum sp.]MCB4746666.1 c-type cytochrome [Sulfurovum sp.]MCB4748830.1 c-type cytochrome [Sulfurovum sp.]MCB4749923.1 c-type cytochrome [Sulfurovum sp.]